MNIAIYDNIFTKMETKWDSDFQKYIKKLSDLEKNDIFQNFIEISSYNMRIKNILKNIADTDFISLCDYTGILLTLANKNYYENKIHSKWFNIWTIIWNKNWILLHKIMDKDIKSNAFKVIKRDIDNLVLDFADFKIKIDENKKGNYSKDQKIIVKKILIKKIQANIRKKENFFKMDFFK